MSLKRIAELSGASVATVSRVLNQPDYRCRDAALQRRIWEAADRLQYVPNTAARELKAGQTEEKAFQADVFLTRFQSLDDDIFFRELYEILRGELLERRCHLRSVLTLPDMIARSQSAPSKDAVSGLILLGKCPPELLPYLKRQYENLVGIDRNPTSFDYDEVFCDGSLAAETAMDYLISLGHKKIAYIGDCSYEARYIGYHQALMAHRLPLDYSSVYPTGQTRREGRQVMEQILAKDHKPTAIFCANDSTALGVLEVLRGKRKRSYLPSVISIDNIREAETSAPMLTTINIPRREMAHHAAALLTDRIRGGHRENVKIELPGRLIVRESCSYCIE